MTLRNIDWATLDLDCFHTARQISDSDFPWNTSCIVAIAKGGLIPARIIARHLKIDRIYCVGAKAYSGIESNEELKVYQGLPSISSMSVIIVDDISDRGNTLDEIKTLCKCICPTGANIVTAAPYFKTGTSHIPNFSIKEFDKDNWVVFPWEDDPEDV